MSDDDDPLEIPYTEDVMTIVVEDMVGWWYIRCCEGFAIADPVGPFPTSLTAMAAIPKKLLN